MGLLQKEEAVKIMVGYRKFNGKLYERAWVGMTKPQAQKVAKNYRSEGKPWRARVIKEARGWSVFLRLQKRG